MAQLKGHEVQQVVQLFETELSMLPKINRIEKMKLRKRINSTIIPAMNQPYVTVEFIVHHVENKLDDVLSIFVDSDRFKSKLNRLLKEFLS